MRIRAAGAFSAHHSHGQQEKITGAGAIPIVRHGFTSGVALASFPGESPHAAPYSFGAHWSLHSDVSATTSSQRAGSLLTQIAPAPPVTRPHSKR